MKFSEVFEELHCFERCSWLKTDLGSGKMAHGKANYNVDCDTRSPRSVESVSTRQEPWRQRGSGSLGGGGRSHLQMGNLGSTDFGTQRRAGPSVVPVDDPERVGSHAMASTSLRCGFHWLERKLAQEFEDWRQDFGGQKNGLDEAQSTYRCTEVPRRNLSHIIGKGGRMLAKIERFAGVFVCIVDYGSDDAEVMFTGLPRACLLAEFIVNMIEVGYYSIIESLVANGF